jgi:hypothetical protein
MKTLTKQQVDYRLKKLNSIDFILNNSSLFLEYPKLLGYIFNFSLYFVCFEIFLVFIIDSPLPYHNYIALLIGGIGLMLYHRFNKTPGTKEELIDKLLTEYRPVNIKAYNDLKKEIKECDYMNYAYINHWITTETLTLKKSWQDIEFCKDQK